MLVKILTNTDQIIANMDSIDRKILELIQINSRTPISKIAENANTSTASIQRRMRQLRKTGIIQSEVAIIDPKLAGFGITAVISVELERDRIDQVRDFKDRALNEPYVQHCYCVAGDTDFVLIVLARDMNDYEEFSNRFFLSDSNVRRFRTSIVVSRVKTSTIVPMQIREEDQ